jgi:hypothetical protein
MLERAGRRAQLVHEGLTLSEMLLTIWSRVEDLRPQGESDLCKVTQLRGGHSELEKEFCPCSQRASLTCRCPECSCSRRWSAWPAARRSRASGCAVENWSSRFMLVRAVATGTSRWLSPKKEAG